MTTIRFYLKGPEEYRFLSNIYPSPFTIGGHRYKSNEHFVQSQKAVDPKKAVWVRAAPTALEARRRGRKVSLRPDWESVKLNVMAEGILAKFSQRPRLRAKMLATGDAISAESPSAFRGKGRSPERPSGAS